MHLSIRITTNQWVPWAIYIDFPLPSILHLSSGTHLMTHSLTSSLFYLDARKFMDSEALDFSHLPLCTLASYVHGKERGTWEKPSGGSIHFPLRQQNSVLLYIGNIGSDQSLKVISHCPSYTPLAVKKFFVSSHKHL